MNDRTVPFATAHISPHDPFRGYPHNGVEVTYDPEYPPIITSYSVPTTPPPPPTKRWYQLVPALPPFIRGRFKRATIYVLSPILVPLLFSFLIARFTLATYNSRKRIHLLEKDYPGETRLANMLRGLEQGVGEAMAQMVDQPGEVDSEALQHTQDRSSDKRDLHDAEASMPMPSLDEPHQPGQFIFKPVHRRMIADLNSIPQLQKHIAFMPEYHNTHAVIVVRDPDQFEWHDVGRGVVRHWADRFEF